MLVFRVIRAGGERGEWEGGGNLCWGEILGGDGRWEMGLGLGDGNSRLQIEISINIHVYQKEHFQTKNQTSYLNCPFDYTPTLHYPFNHSPQR